MRLEGLCLHRSHVIDFFGRFALVFPFTSTRKGRDHATDRKGVNLFGENFGRTARAVFKASGVPTWKQPGFGFISIVEQGLSSGHLEKFRVQRASVEGQLVGLQGWNFGGGTHDIDAVLREFGTTDLRGRTRTSILDAS